MGRILFKSKRAELGFNEIISIIFVIFSAFVLISIVFLIRHTVATILDTSAAEAQSYYNNILYSKGGIMYYDEDIDRVYPWIVEKLDSNRLDNSLKFHSVHENKEIPAAKLQLENRNTREIQTVYWNEKWYHRLLTKTGMKGRGSPYRLTKTANVQIYDNGTIFPGVIDFDIIVPRR